jgi:tetraacyldisaccharide 4'-kinase
VPELRGVERLWFSSDPAARAARVALVPLELVYGSVVALRGALYDSGVLTAHAPRLPALSVGNLTVGGTGKTPISAWVASELASRGARPAIVLRGYGRDEPLVHRLLNPGMTVIATPDRLLGIERAAEAGCDIAVLDDAFQHRRSARAADVVLVSADRWSERRRLLPAGPWREPLEALRRASLVVVTRKAATAEEARRVADRIRRVVPAVDVAIIHLGLGRLHPVRDFGDASTSNGTSGARPMAADDVVARLGGRTGDASPGPIRATALAGQRIVAISAIGDPAAFARQLESLGARVESHPFADHHDFTTADAERLAHAAESAARGARDGQPVAVCTLKDAVKLAPLWPREAPRLWYVSQQPEVESGRAAIDALLAATLAASHRQP